MKKSILSILILIFSFNDFFPQLSDTKYESVIKYFVDCIKNADIDKLDSIVTYPIARLHPDGSSINNKQELIEHFSEIFDYQLTSIISNSNIKEDWSDVGYRGLMLKGGIIWLSLGGNFIASNYEHVKDVGKVPTILGIINKDNLKDFSYNFCRYSRNEIFARKGYAFKSKDLDLYFGAQPWYKKNTDATISLNEYQKQTVNLFQDFEKKQTAKENKCIVVDGYPVFFVDREAYLLPKEFLWALPITTLPKEYITAKAIDKLYSERTFEKDHDFNLVVTYDYIGSDIEACGLWGVVNGKFNSLFSKDGYNLKASVNANKDLSISGSSPTYLCGIFITGFEYLFSPKTRVAIMLPTNKEVFTTNNTVTLEIEIENKEGVPYKIKLPEGTEVIIRKYKNKPNCYFIESKLGSGWIYGEPCGHFYMVG